MDNQQDPYQVLVNEIRNLRTEMGIQKQEFETALDTHRSQEETLRSELKKVSARQHRDSPGTPTAPAPARTEHSHPRPRHPDPEPFSGEDQKDYLPFQMNLRTKFIIDAACYPTEEEKVYYAYSRLSGKASQRMLPWLKAKQDQNTPVRWGDFTQALDKAFDDPDRQRKALVRVNTMKQGKKTLEEFLNEFDGELLNAGGVTWTDAQKKALLDTAIHWQLLQGMVGIEQAQSYEGYCNQLRRIDHDLQRIEQLSRKGKRMTTANPPPHPTPKDTDQMDWEPTTAQLAATERRKTMPRTNRREQQWASDEVLQTRRSQGRCLRCGSQDHFVRNCQEPLSQSQRPNRIAIVESTTQKQEEDQTLEDSRLGKE